MKKNFRSAKTGVILGLILISMFVAIVPNASAGILKINPSLSVQHTRPDDNIIPKSGLLIINLTINAIPTGIGATFLQISAFELTMRRTSP